MSERNEAAGLYGLEPLPRHFATTSGTRHKALRLITKLAAVYTSGSDLRFLIFLNVVFLVEFCSAAGDSCIFVYFIRLLAGRCA